MSRSQPPRPDPDGEGNAQIGQLSLSAYFSGSSTLPFDEPGGVLTLTYVSDASERRMSPASDSRGSNPPAEPTEAEGEPADEPTILEAREDEDPPQDPPAS